jgi:hypothetical protein
MAMDHEVACSVTAQLNPSKPAAGGGDSRCVGFCIGGVSLSVHFRARTCIPVGTPLDLFRVSFPVSDLDLHVKWADWLPQLSKRPCFDSGAVWSLRTRLPQVVFDFESPAFRVAPYGRMLIDPEFRNARLLLNEAAFVGNCNLNPLQYPADELLFTNYLAHHSLGVEVHGCGLIDPETGGHLFLGHSGAGKSTTSRLWKFMRNAEILSDDRIILRLHDGELWMYGTPWHGEGVFASPAKARVKSIFVLQHGLRNRFTQVPYARAVAELFARSFPPFHSAVGLGNTMDFLARVLVNVPCYDFEFTPDIRAVEEVLRFHA